MSTPVITKVRALEMPRSSHLDGASVVIVGAGVIGSTLGYRLAQAGAQVTVVDRGAPGSGMSGRTFAHANGTGKTPRDYQRLNMSGIRALEDLADEVGGRWIHVGGALHWADAADSARVAALREMARQMIGWGTRVDTLSREEALRLEPELALDPAIREVLRIDRAAWVETVLMITATLAAAARRYGAAFVRGDVVAMSSERGLIETVELADGTVLQPDLVIDAAGADAPRVAALAGGAVSIERSPGLLVSTLPLAASLDHVVYAPWANIRPDGGNRVMLQVESLDIEVRDGESIEPGDARVAKLLEAGTRVMPAVRDAVVASIVVGVRALPTDGHPIVGFDERVANLYHVVTHSGITLAARLALLVTEDLTGGDPAPLEPYRPSRFGPARSSPVAGSSHN